ncbi:MAG: hypothetical protein R3D55_16065 [Chloroflexota bacterium]
MLRLLLVLLITAVSARQSPPSTPTPTSQPPALNTPQAVGQITPSPEPYPLPASQPATEPYPASSPTAELLYAAARGNPHRRRQRDFLAAGQRR